MESYIVKLTETAKNDMYEIYYYIADRLLSPENAIGQYNRIADSILSLIFNISNCGDNCAKYILELDQVEQSILPSLKQKHYNHPIQSFD